MNGPIWLAWVVTAIIAVLSVILLSGKGSFLIAGFNTASKQEKEKYNVKRLCRVVGGGLGVITIMLGISVYYKFEFPYSILKLMMPWGLFIVIAAIAILTNTVCKKK